jgi:hypothetical protein
MEEQEKMDIGMIYFYQNRNDVGAEDDKPVA